MANGMGLASIPLLTRVIRIVDYLKGGLESLVAEAIGSFG